MLSLRPLVVAFFMVLVSVSACGSSQPTVVTAQFSDAAGLFVGNDVGVLGVKVGSVSEITPNGDHVDVTLRIDDGVKVPASAGAVIVSRSVATDRYVELTPVYDHGPVLASGTVLRLDKTRTPVEFDELLASLTTVADQLSGDESVGPLNDLLDVGAKTLDGNGEKIAASMRGLADTLGDVDEASPDIIGALDNVDQLTEALADNDALVRRFTAEVAEAVSMLDDQSDAFETTFTVLSMMMQRIADFSHEHRTHIASQIDDITTLSTALLEHRGELEVAITTLPLTLQNIQGAIDENGRLTMRTRPADLVPGEEAIRLVCESLPAAVCEGTGLDDLSLLDLLDALAGVGS